MAEKAGTDRNKGAEWDEIIARRLSGSLSGHDWYAIRTIPGSQRMARTIDPANDETEDQTMARERRKGESILERNLRNEGIEVYMPAYWYESTHHRSRKTIRRRLPLLVGYAFVDLAGKSFETVREVEGVICFLRSAHGPVRFSGDDLAIIAAEEFRRRQEFRREALVRMEKEKSNQVLKLRGQLRKVLPKGRANKINLKDQAMLTIDSMEKEARKKVLGILQQIEALEGQDDLASIDRVA